MAKEKKTVVSDLTEKTAMTARVVDKNSIVDPILEEKKHAFNEQFHKCEPPVEIKKRLDDSALKIGLDKRSISQFLAQLPPLEMSSKYDSGVMIRKGGVAKTVRSPQWKSVALFYNLAASITKPGDYAATTVEDVVNWIDEGSTPCNPTIKEFMYDYWNTLSYGNLRFSIEVARNASGTPIVPTVTPTLGSATDWPNIAEAIIKGNALAVWQAAGSIIKDGKRFIPSVVLVHKYGGHAWAWFGVWLEFTTGGNTYVVGDFTHVVLELAQTTLPTGHKVRNSWAHPLCHEYAHNFIEGPDLYGPGGCTGYWDILGDYLAPGLMAESSSLFKAKLGWLRFKEIINGPEAAIRSLSLRPYTTTGDAYKIIPDPVNNPYEYFLLEFRKSTGTAPHIPDGGLVGNGLLISHINERLGIWGKPWVLREAPLFDPEYADYSDFGGALWHGIAQKDQFKVLYPTPSNNRFTPTSRPSSHLYGDRNSGLSITNIQVVGDLCSFNVEIHCSTQRGWLTGAEDRGLAGRFTSASTANGQEIFFRNRSAVALLQHTGGQVFTKSRQDNWIDGWNLGADNREIVGDFDGDGKDEIFVRSPEWAGLFKYYTNAFRCDAIQHDWIDGWNLGPDNWELAADLDGDGKDEIYIRSPRWAGVIGYNRGRFQLKHIANEWIDQWHLGPDNKEFVGRFSQNLRDEILIKSPEWLGLIYWDTASSKLKLKKLHNDWIDGWNLGPGDQLYIADLDGDGLSEIYIRSAKWAGVLKWRANRFQVLWMIENNIPQINNVLNQQLPLSANDKSYAGKFFNNKDGIIHRIGNKLALLIWEGGRMNVRFQLADWYTGSWSLSDTDKFIFGDFHKIGTEGYSYVDASSQVLPYDHITNNLTDLFIHNASGTGMVCLNYVPANLGDPNWKGAEWTLSWLQPQYLVKK